MHGQSFYWFEEALQGTDKGPRIRILKATVLSSVLLLGMWNFHMEFSYEGATNCPVVIFNLR